MKVLLVNTSDAKGGAAIVARRLLHALNHQKGVEAKMLVAEKSTDDEAVIALPKTWWIKKALDRMVVWAANGFSKRGLWLTDGGFFGNDITKLKEFQEADVIHLHWVNQGFLGLKDIEKVLNSGKMVVWTLHDMWPTTSICHYAGECEKFSEHCSCCPQLVKPSENDLSYKVFEKKKALFASLADSKTRNFSFIGCSNWVSSMVKKSAITSKLPVVTIPNAIDMSHYSVSDKALAKEKLGISKETKVICFGAARIDTPIKGFNYLLEALKIILQRNKSENVELLLMGGINDKSLLEEIPISYKYLGYVTDTTPIYRASDCLVNCSLFENLGTTMVEAQACGCTPAAFDTGGTKDIVKDGITGYIAKPQDAASLAEAMEKALSSPISPSELNSFAMSNFSTEVVAQRHIEIYNL